MRQSMNKVAIIIFVLVILLIVSIYLLILNFGYIKNHDSLRPTGNVDIFDIDCDCSNCNNSDDKKSIGSSRSDSNDSNIVDENKSDDIDKNKLDDSVNDDSSGLIVSDNYTVWGSKKLRIFSNQAYEYTSKIAPSSANSYVFVIRNNNTFDIVVDISMVEDNPYKVNMKYKLRSKGVYLAGNDSRYDEVSKLNVRNITIKSKESISYILDWKWIDSDNDTSIGESIDANYKLSINIGAKRK